MLTLEKLASESGRIRPEIKLKCVQRKSCGSGHTRVHWSMTDAEEVARDLFKQLPHGVHMKIKESTGFTGIVVAIQNDTGYNIPVKDDVKVNYPFLIAIVRKWRDRVPSGYAIADVLLCLDDLMNGKLLHPHF